MNNFPESKTQDLRPKILITGAKGQLGKKIIDLLGEKYRLILTDADDMDITNAELVNKRFAEEKPDYVIHGAAYTKVDAAEENEELCKKINSLGSKNIAEAAKNTGATVVYISTDYVFDGEKNTPYTEEDDANPLSVYGETKLQGEEFIEDICDKYYIMRIAWLFGELPEGHPGTNFVESMLRLASERDSLNIVNDQIGSPTYTGDLVKTIDEVITKRIPYGRYHFSGNEAASWYDFAKEIFERTDTKIMVNPITSDQYPQKAKRPGYSYMSKEKIEKALGFKVRSWKEMLDEYLVNRA